jgi:hypothetical protein
MGGFWLLLWGYAQGMSTCGWGKYVVGILFPVLELSVRWYTVVYIPDVYIECLPRVS